MKKPKRVNRYCPYCKKHTEHKVKDVTTGGNRGALKRGSISRAKKRGEGRGKGNKGNWGSKPAVSKYKRKTKTTKKSNLRYTCKECGKAHHQKKGIRAGKVEVKARGEP